MVNVGQYTIHGCYGLDSFPFPQAPTAPRPLVWQLKPVEPSQLVTSQAEKGSLATETCSKSKGFEVNHKNWLVVEPTHIEKYARQIGSSFSQG